MFETITELKNRVMPVLKIKSKELNNSVTPDYIFEDLSKNKWRKNTNLHLFEIVRDILNYQNKESDKSETE